MTDPIDEPALRSFLERYLEAWNARDPEAVLSCVSEDVSWINPSLPGDGTARGHEPVRAWLRGFFRTFPDVTFTPLEHRSESEPRRQRSVDDPDLLTAAYVSQDRRRVAMPWRCTATMLGPLEPPGVPPTGQKFDVTGVDLYAFRDARACSVHTITDLQSVGRQLGLIAAPGSLSERIGLLVLRARRLLRPRSRVVP